MRSGSLPPSSHRLVPRFHRGEPPTPSSLSSPPALGEAACSRPKASAEGGVSMAGGVVEESCVRVTCWLETRSEGERAERAVAIFHFSIISMAAPPLAASPRPMSGRALAGRIASATFTRLRGGVCNRAGASVRAAASAAADPLPSTSTSASSPPAPLPRGAYVHLPFCVRKCLYCDFAVQALGARAAAAVAPLSPGALRGAPATQTLNRTRPPALDY